MANPTTNFGWVMPTSSSLVTNLPADFNTFGQGVDTSMAQLKGGTTGQILSKTSATDMAFTWITNDVGDITAVTAGTGISGGGTSGAVTITNSMATEIAAKGDLIVGTGSATFDNLGVGTNGQVLTADSTVSPTGLKWATPASGGGKVLQVVQGTYSTGVTVASTTYADTGLSLSITPSSASSKILVFVNQSYYNIRNTTNSSGLAIKLLRNSTTIFTPAPTGYETDFITVGGAITQVLHIGVAPLTYLDSPSTTSSVTYKTQGRTGNTADSGSVIFQNDAYSTITLMEIGA